MNDKKINVEDLTPKQRLEIFQNFRNRNEKLIRLLQQTFADILIEKSVGDLMCLIDTFAIMAQHTTNKLLPHDNNIFKNASWLSRNIGKV